MRTLTALIRYIAPRPYLWVIVAILVLGSAVFVSRTKRRKQDPPPPFL